MRGNSLTPKQINRRPRGKSVKSVAEISASRNKKDTTRNFGLPLEFYSSSQLFIDRHVQKTLAISRETKRQIKGGNYVCSEETLKIVPVSKIATYAITVPAELSFIREMQSKTQHRVAYRKTHINDGLRRWSACQVVHPPKSPCAPLPLLHRPSYDAR